MEGFFLEYNGAPTLAQTCVIKHGLPSFFVRYTQGIGCVAELTLKLLAG